MKQIFESILKLRGQRLFLFILCTLLMIQPMTVFAMILGPGLLAPTFVQPGEIVEEETDEEPGQNSEEEAEHGPGHDSATEEDPAEQQKALEKQKAREEAEERGMLVLINKTHTVDSSFKPDDLTSIKYYASNRSESGRYMRKEAADHFHQMVEAAADEGLKIVMTTAYRSYGFQQVLWNNYVAKDGEAAASKYSARPGTSEHQSGLAVDVSSPSVSYELTRDFAGTEEGKWLADNAHRFGFIIRYPLGKEDITGYMYEPWHLRYVSPSVAGEIYEAGITLEEYLEIYFR